VAPTDRLQKENFHAEIIQIIDRSAPKLIPLGYEP